MSNRFVKSVYRNQQSLIEDIVYLHVPEACIDLDPAFNLGKMYPKEIQPGIKGDIKPILPGVIKMDAENLDFVAGAFNSIFFDPPFLIKNGGTLNKMALRYGYYRTLKDLQVAYANFIASAARVLKTDGIYVFKCQDIIHDRRRYFTSLLVVNLAMAAGFNWIDEFILVANSRIHAGGCIQNASRSYHCKFLVFKKRKGRRRYEMV